MKAMKMFAAMVCAAMVLILTGCSKDKDNGNGSDLVGSWSLQSTTITETIHGQSHSETETPEEGESIVYNFKKDNTFSMVVVYQENEYVQTGSYSTNDGQLTLKFEEDDPYTGSYKIEGDDLTMIFTVEENGSTLTTENKLKKI